MTPEQQLAILAPHARALADAAYDMQQGCAAVNFDNGIVVYVNNIVPGADDFRKAVKKLFESLPDAKRHGTI